jgi:hypothetical protein
VIAIDTNLLVYAHRPECPSHEVARSSLAELAASGDAWGVPLHCLVEFAAVVSNPRLWMEPSPPSAIADQVAAWRECPTMHVLCEDADWWPTFIGCLESGRAQGGAVHDARIAACSRYHGVRALWTADRDFGRYPWLATVNPLVG